MTAAKDTNGNFIPWTGQPTKKNRTHGGRYSVQHTGASGWFVFDNRDDRVVKDGLGSLENATAVAKVLASGVVPGTSVVWSSGTGRQSVLIKDVQPGRVQIDDGMTDLWVRPETLRQPTSIRSDL